MFVKFEENSNRIFIDTFHAIVQSLFMTHEPDLFPLLVQQKRPIAKDIWLFRLAHPKGHALPTFTAGAHVTVQTPSGQKRNYSLCNNPFETAYCELAIKHERQGRGGSQSMVEQVQEGDLLQVSMPKNDFGLVDHLNEVIFIAGGIGVTPLLSMLRQMHDARSMHAHARFHFYYCARDKEGAAFVDTLEELSQASPLGQVSFHFDGGHPDQGLDLWPVLEKPTAAHIYCCGPEGLMDAVRDMSGHWPQGRVHFESFGASGSQQFEPAEAFEVKLHGKQQTIAVAANESILEALRKNGHYVPSSCESGTCGSCKVDLISGHVEHRDFVLNDEEKRHHIMVCVSRAPSGVIEISL
jgi:phthalate 4,5-dioxygenase reductase subunit